MDVNWKSLLINTVVRLDKSEFTGHASLSRYGILIELTSSSKYAAHLVLWDEVEKAKFDIIEHTIAGLEADIRRVS